MARPRRLDNAWTLDPLDMPSERAMERVPAMRGLEHNAAYRMMLFRRRSLSAQSGAEGALGSLLIVDVLELQSAGLPAEEVVLALWGAGATERQFRLVKGLWRSLAIGAGIVFAASGALAGREIATVAFWMGVAGVSAAAIAFEFERHWPYLQLATAIGSVGTFAFRVSMLEKARRRRANGEGSAALLRHAAAMAGAISLLILVVGGFVGAVWALVYFAYLALNASGLLWPDRWGPFGLILFAWFAIGLWVRSTERAARSGRMARRAEDRLAHAAAALREAFALMNGDGIIEGLRGKNG